MTLLNLIGPPQFAAILLLIQRGCEEYYSARNTRALLAVGAHEIGADYYPVVAATHLAWIASLFFLVSPEAPIIWPLTEFVDISALCQKQTWCGTVSPVRYSTWPCHSH